MSILYRREYHKYIDEVTPLVIVEIGSYHEDCLLVYLDVAKSVEASGSSRKAQLCSLYLE